MLVWLLRALTYQLKGIPYRYFLPKSKKRPWRWVFLNKRQRSQKKMHLSEADKNCSMPEESFMNDASDEE